jgi:hypothetical protein
MNQPLKHVIVSPLARMNVLRKEGQLFALTPLGDFEAEVESLRNNPEFLEFLEQLSQDEAVISLENLRKELGV